MVFENLSARLQETFRKLRGKGKLSEKDVTDALREVRLALLEADVNFRVVKDFVAKVKERAVGQEVAASLTPGQQVVKIVHEELAALMGQKESKLAAVPNPPGVIMLVGLQGSGKTTSCAKLGAQLKKNGRRPLLVAADIYRPAAVKQLQVLGGQLDLPVFSLEGARPPEIARQAVAEALRLGRDAVLIDTAGRLHIDHELMDELKEIKSVVRPHEILLVVDAMTGQDAVNVAEGFHSDLNLTGLILTKLDSDTRGGAALSIRAVTGIPIKFAGVGEKTDQLETFHPDRMASRILGMGDVLSLIEKAETQFDLENSKKLAAKLRSAEFTLEDFLEQMKQVRQMGPLDQLMSMLPGIPQKQLKGIKIDPKELDRAEAIINSMT
ncbi:MAG TPA: signal recognition particle protein, partial [Firmicutes bacterium]|nr:signal recognition particle protein [Bacillota bacterium]HCF92235.1 signal recognition particle protein [Bacillota bacterium]